uniref:protein AF-9-like isoform X2 n=1 Tax=Myxine glutinosa TaxID=7769 RepID=UPI00358F6E06
MASSCTVQVKLELGHRAQVRRKPTAEGFTHDWAVFVRGPDNMPIQHFVEKVIFYLHDSFPKPKRVCKEPPFRLEESGYAGFTMPIEVYFRNKEEPKKVCFEYDLFLNLEGHPPVNHIRCEKLTFSNPTEEFRLKLLMAGGVSVSLDGASATHPAPSPYVPPHPPTMSTLPPAPSGNPGVASDHKKSKPSTHRAKDNVTMDTTQDKTECLDSSFALMTKEPSKGSNNSSSSNSSLPKPHKSSKDHREKPSKDSKEHKSGIKEPHWDPGKFGKEPSKKPKESGRPAKDEAHGGNANIAFKEPKPLHPEHKATGTAMRGVYQGDVKGVASKRPTGPEPPEDFGTKKRKKGLVEVAAKRHAVVSTSPVGLPTKGPGRPIGKTKGRETEGPLSERRKPPLAPLEDVDPNDSEFEDDNRSAKSEVERPEETSEQATKHPPLLDKVLAQHCTSKSAVNGFDLVQFVQLFCCLLWPSEQTSPSSSSSSSFTSTKPRGHGILNTIMQELSNTEDEEDENGLNEDHCATSRRNHRLSDGSDSESSRSPSPPRSEQLSKNTLNKAYLDELVELHRRLMSLRERHILQQIVNLIKETGHFQITTTTFDFDLCMLDKTTVRKLQSYLESSGRS